MYNVISTVERTERFIPYNTFGKYRTATYTYSNHNLNIILLANYLCKQLKYFIGR